MNLTMQYEASNTDRASQDMKKILALSNHITWKQLKGVMTHENVNLIMTNMQDMEIIIAGKLNKKTNTFAAHFWFENVPQGSIDWHPVDVEGKFHLRQFKQNLKEFFSDL